MVLGLPADDQGRSRLVDQDGVHLVNDGVVQRPLDPVLNLIDHVVPEVVKAELVVGSVGDVRLVGGLLFLTGHVGQIDAHRKSKEVVQAPHPLCVPVGQVVIDCHHVNALSGQGIQEHWERRCERLSFARPHLGDLPVVEGHAPQKLHVEMPHLHDALRAFADNRKSLGKDRIQGLASRHTAFEFMGLLAQLLIGQSLELRLHRVDSLHSLAVLLEQTIVATAENFGQEVGGHACRTDHQTSMAGRRPKSLRLVGFK